MSRLTKKYDDGYVLPLDEIKVEGYLKAIEKLGKLEDLEEELGYSLEFIFKVLKSPKIYIEGMNVRSEYDDRFKFNAKANQYIINPYAIDGKKPEFLFVDRWDYGYDLRMKDYKKTWWLKEDKSE